MEGADGPIDCIFWRSRGAGFDHFGKQAGLLVIQCNGRSCDSLLSSQYRIWDRLSRNPTLPSPIFVYRAVAVRAASTWAEIHS
jgi:hypothetical protein